jgi:transposase
MALEQTLSDMQQRIVAHEKRLEKLEVRTRKNSHNSSKPPSSDPPFNRQKRRKQKKSKRSKGGQKGHKANQQQMLNPTESHWLIPEALLMRACRQFDQKSMQPVLRPSAYRTS